MDQSQSQRQPPCGGGHFTLPAMMSSSTSMMMNNHKISVGVNPYYLVLGSNPSKTLSLPRADTNSTDIYRKNSKRNSKSFLEEPPLVNPAFNDGSIRPIAISDYDDPLRLHRLPQQNLHPDSVEIKTNYKNPQPQKLKNDITNQQHNRGIPSFRLTKNVTSTLSKVTNPIEFCTLPRVSLYPIPSQKMDQIPLSSFRRDVEQPTTITLHPDSNNPQQRYSTSSTVSNQSSDISGDPSTTSSLYYVDCRNQPHQNRSSTTSVSSASSTITGSNSSSCSSGDEEHQHQDSTSSTIEQHDDDLPPPPDTLLHDDDEEIQDQQMTPTNKSAPTTFKNVAELLPPLPPSDYHSASTLQRRKFQQHQHFANVNQQKSTNTDVPAYSTTLSSFQGNNNYSDGNRNGTLRKPPPPPPPRPPISVSDACSLPSTTSSTSSYADPSSLSIGGGSTSSPITDNLTMTPSPTSDHYQQPESLRQRQPVNQTKTLFNRNSSPTYGWVYHQPGMRDSNNTFEIKRFDSLSLTESGSAGQPNSLESGDSRQPLSHSFDTNNNKKKKKQNQNSNHDDSYVYRNHMFIMEDEFTKKNNDDEQRTKVRIIDQSYRMFFDSPDDSPGIHDPTGNKLKDVMNEHKKPKFLGQQQCSLREKENCCKRWCRSTIIILTLTLLFLVLILFGISIYNHFVLNQPETGFSAVELIKDFVFGKKISNNAVNNSTTTLSTSALYLSSSTPTILSSLSTTVTILMNTWNLTDTSPTMKMSNSKISPPTTMIPMSSFTKFDPRLVQNAMAANDTGNITNTLDPKIGTTTISPITTISSTITRKPISIAETVSTTPSTSNLQLSTIKMLNKKDTEIPTTTPLTNLDVVDDLYDKTITTNDLQFVESEGTIITVSDPVSVKSNTSDETLMTSVSVTSLPLNQITVHEHQQLSTPSLMFNPTTIINDPAIPSTLNSSTQLTKITVSVLTTSPPVATILYNYTVEGFVVHNNNDGSYSTSNADAIINNLDFEATTIPIMTSINTTNDLLQ